MDELDNDMEEPKGPGWKFGFLAVLFMIWYSISSFDILYSLPSPSEVFTSFVKSFVSLLVNGLYTTLGAVLGLVASSLLSCTVGSIFSVYPLLRSSMYYWIFVFQAIPILAIAPIIIPVFGTGLAGTAAVSCLISFFPLVVQVTKGLNDFTPDQLRLFHSLGANRCHVFLKLQVPSSVGSIFVGLRTASALSVVGATVGEFLAPHRGIGYLIYVNNLNFEYGLVAAAALVGGAISIALVLSIFGLEWLLSRKLGGVPTPLI